MKTKIPGMAAATFFFVALASAEAVVDYEYTIVIGCGGTTPVDTRPF